MPWWIFAVKYYACVVPNPYQDLLIYSAEEAIPLGAQVRVPYGAQERYAWTWSEVSEDDLPQVPIRGIVSVSSPPLLHEAWRVWMTWVAQYYHYPLVAFATQHWPRFLWEALPSLPEAYLMAYPHPEHASILMPGGLLLQEKLWRWPDLARAPVSIEPPSSYLSSPFSLTDSQRDACAQIVSDHFQVYALEGPTGSGKTEVYLDRACALAHRHQVLLLLPEIALTESMMARLTARLGYAPWVYHSQLPKKLRCHHWLAAAHHAKGLWVGTRSAVFLPGNWHMVMMDEEHDASYVESQKMYYSSKHMFLMRAKQSQTAIVLGSATLSLETLYHAQSGRYHHVQLKKFYHAPMGIRVVDARAEPCVQGMSVSLWKALDHHLQRGHQVLLFLNRRGYAPVLFCHSCGWKKECTDCDTHMVLHRRTQRLRCHHCDRSEAVPEQCPLGHSTLVPVGMGTQRLEESLAARYPEVSLIRMDQDSGRGEHERLHELLASGAPAIIVGTQMITKGFDAPALRCVLVVDLDYALCHTAYRADEQVYQLLTQVMGRAARRARHASEGLDELWVQTSMPEHHLWTYVQAQRLDQYPTQLLAWRRTQGLPPFSYVCRVRLEGKKEALLLACIASFKKAFVQFASMHDVVCYGPWPAPIRRKRQAYHYWGMLITSERREMDRAMDWVAEYCSQHKGIIWRLDRDAQGNE